MDFEYLKKTVGFGLAVCICNQNGTLPDDLNLDFEQLCKVLDAAEPGAFADSVLKQAAGIATREQLDKLLRNHAEGMSERDAVLAQILDAAEDECAAMYVLNHLEEGSDGDLVRRAFDRTAELATSYSILASLAERTPDDKIRTTLFDRTIEAAEGKIELGVVFSRSEPGSPQAKRVLKRLIDCCDFDDLCVYYKKTRHDSEKEMLERAIERVGTVQEWLKVMRTAGGDDWLKGLATDRIIERGTYQELTKYYESINWQNRELRQRVLLALVEKADTPRKIHACWKRADRGSEARARAFVRLTEMAKKQR